jgi:hypothetical protein
MVAMVCFLPLGDVYFHFKAAANPGQVLSELRLYIKMRKTLGTSQDGRQIPLPISQPYRAVILSAIRSY